MSPLRALRERFRFHAAAAQFRAVRRAGLRAWLRDGPLWREILATPPVTTEPAEEGAEVEVHLLCNRHDHLLALWALKTFYHFAAVRWPLAIHLHGSVPGRVAARLRGHFPHARIIPQALADERVDAVLRTRGLERLRAERALNPYLRKVVDFVVLAHGRRVLGLDSDVLFFAPPAELLKGAARGTGSLFQRDVANGYTVTPAYARSHLGRRLPPRVNTGIMAVARDEADLERCERYLADRTLARPLPVLEQTLHALCAGERGPVRYLPPRYRLSLARCVDDDGGMVARHYAGPSRWMIGDGMRRLRARGVLDDMRAAAES